MPESLTYTLPVHTFQIDFAGVVSNTVYVQWMEIARTLLLDAIGMPMKKAWAAGIVPILVHTTIDYKHPFVLGDEVHGELWISEMRNTSARLEHRFSNSDGRLCATGHQVGLFVDKHTLRPHRLTAEQHALFAPFVMESASPPER